MVTIEVTAEQLDTILAALRHWQAAPPTDPAILDIATDSGEHAPLDDAAIDDLCEEINCSAAFT